ncbi:MAG: hypothetical protein ACRDD1_09980, partial [Planctomycetia bacterium]
MNWFGRPYRPSLPNLLLATHRPPAPPDGGDRIRAFQTLESLADECNVFLASVASKRPAPEAVDLLREYVVEVAFARPTPLRGALAAAVGAGPLRRVCGGFAPFSLSGWYFYSAGLRNRIADWTRRHTFEYGVASSSATAPYLDLLPAGARTIVDFTDVDSEKWLQLATLESGWRRAVYRCEGRWVRRVEQAEVDRRDGVVVTTNAELTTLRTLTGATSAAAVTNRPPAAVMPAFDAPPKPTAP